MIVGDVCRGEYPHNLQLAILFIMRLRDLLFGSVLCGALTASSPLIAGDWPQWRGPSRTGLSTETGLLKAWPASGPKQLWLFRNAGKGYSGPAIAKGQLFTLGTRENKEILLCLDAKAGRETWATPIGTILDNNWGDGPRGTPTVDGDRVYALSGSGDLVCARVTDGRILWQASMNDLGGKTPGWGFTESVLVDGDMVICTPGGSKGALAALNKTTGQVVWRSEGFTEGAQYASPIVIEHNGQRQYVQLTMKVLAGVSAKDGKVMWTSDWPGSTAVIPTPIHKDGFVYVTSGYGVGCKLVELGKGDVARDVYENKVMKNHHGGVILLGDHLFGHSDGPGWVCQDFKTGEEVWASKEFGKGAIGYADGMFYCLEEATGAVALIEATPKGWMEKGRFTLEPQSEIRSSSGRIWTHPVVSNGKLFLRDQDLIYCYDVEK